MEFFQQIFSTLLGNGDTLQLVLTKKDDELTVALMPGASANGVPDHMIPLVLTSTPQELDSAFFETITEPLTRANGIIGNVKQFDKSVQKERTNSNLGKKDTKELDKLLQEADKQESQNNYDGAIVMLTRAETKPGADKQAIAERIKSLRQKAGVGTLFGEEETLTYNPIEEEDEE